MDRKIQGDEMNSSTAMEGERAAALIGAALKLCGNTKKAQEMFRLAADLRRQGIKASAREEAI